MFAVQPGHDTTYRDEIDEYVPGVQSHRTEIMICKHNLCSDSMYIHIKELLVKLLNRMSRSFNHFLM